MASSQSTENRSAVIESPESKGAIDAKGLKVLVVDDEPVTLLKLERTVRAHGYDVTTFPDGRRAWEQCCREFFPLVILDWQMPGMDGLELCRRLRRQPRGDQQEILIVTANDSPESLQAVLDAGADDYLTKPFSTNILDVRLAVARMRAEIKSERWSAQRELERQHDWLEVTLASIGDGVMTADCDGMITFINHEAERLTGWAASDALGQPLDHVFQIINGETGERVENPALAALREKKTVWLPQDTLLLTKDGARVPIDDSGSPIRDKNGVIHGGVLIFRDISAKVRAEKAVKESLAWVERVKQEWESTADSLPQLVCLLDKDGSIIRANRTTETWNLLPVTQIMGVNFHDLFHPDCDDDTCYLSDLWQQARAITSQKKTADWEVEDKKLGRWFHYEFRPMKERTDQRKMATDCSAVVIVEDITERKLMEMELDKAREHEIEIGSRIQQSLLIGHPPSNTPGLSLSAMSIASQRIDGDFYAFFQPNEETLDVIVGDVMGKGIPAALIGAATKNHFLGAMSLLVARSGGAKLPEPEDVVSLIHDEMAERLINLDSFVTLCYARFNLEKNQITYVNCGHPNTIHYRQGTAQCESLEGLNMPLGFAAKEEYEQVTVPFDQGDAFLFYSDGVIEAQKTKGDLFGEERLAEYVARNSAAPPKDMIEGIRTAVIKHAGSTDFSDDLTCIAVKIDDEQPAQTGHRLVEFTSDLAELERIRDFVRSFYNDQKDWDRNEKEEFELELSVNEAAANIIKHAYRGEPGHPIWLGAQRSNGRITFSLYHRGEEFDPQEAPPPLFDGSRDSGYGLYIIGHSMDEVSYTRDINGRNVIRLVKYHDEN